MRLWNKNDTPVGGWYYDWQDESGRNFRTTGVSGGLKGLARLTRREMSANNVKPPLNLEDYIEDQICGRVPKGKCYYEAKAGDMVSATIHTFARTADSVASSLGIKTSLEKKARGCSSCGKRRVKLNSI